MTTISHWLRNSSLKLKKISSSPHMDAEIILAFVLKVSKEKLITNNNLYLKNKHLEKANILLKQRLLGVPIAYLIKEKSFYGLSFIVNKNVLIPRPDSESIVDAALILLKEVRKPTVLEIGVGSGALIISFVKNFKNNLHAYGFDISKSALAVAKKNIDNHQLSRVIKIKQNNLLTNWPQKKKIDLIIANLPYLPNNYLKQHKFLEEKSLKFEPKISLFAGKDGLELYRQLNQQLLKINFKYLIIEVLPQQIKIATAIFKNKNYSIKSFDDLGGTKRFLQIEKLS